jgi:hypothetical protein
VGAASTKSGRSGTAGRAGPGERDEKVYARNRCCYASASSNPADVGWFAVRTRLRFEVGNSLPGIARWGGEAMVNVYGVAMAMPQG